MLLTYWWINHEVSFYGLEKHGLEKNSCAHMRSYTSMCEGIYVAVSLKTDNDKGTMLDFQSIFKASWEYKAFMKIISANNVLQKDTWFGILCLLPCSHFIYLEGMRLKMRKNIFQSLTLRYLFYATLWGRNLCTWQGEAFCKVLWLVLLVTQSCEAFSYSTLLTEATEVWRLGPQNCIFSSEAPYLRSGFGIFWS